MGWLTVIAPGAHTLVQDLGFIGGRSQGVPPGGVMDRAGLLLLNALLGDPPGTEVLEVTLTGPTLLAEGAAMRVALSGTVSGQVVATDGGTRHLPAWTATTLAEGERLVVSAPSAGPYGMIGVAGGIDVPRLLGSRSTCLRAGFGGFQGRALAAGDRLSVRPAAPGQPDRRLRPPAPDEGPIRLVPGPQGEWFGAGGLQALTSQTYIVTPDCDRMGMRLDGPDLPFAPGFTADILSDGIVPGAIQVPANGQPIVLLAHAQTTGGYAKIATVIGTDLPRLARLSPGDRLHFAALSVAEAEELARAARQALEQATASIEDVGDPAPLLGANLIGGVVDMARPDHFDGHLGPADEKADAP